MTPYIKMKHSYLNDEEMKRMTIAISNLCNSSLKEEDERAWKMIQGNIDFTEYDYLTKMTNPDSGEDYVFPAKLRWIPIQRKNVNALVGIKSRREFRYQVKATDKRSLQDKRQSQIKKVIDMYLQEITMAQHEMELFERSVMKQLGKLNQQQQEAQQQLQMMQQQAQESGEQLDPNVIQQIEQMVEAIEQYKEQMADQLAMAKKQMEPHKLMMSINHDKITELVYKDDIDIYGKYATLLLIDYRKKLSAIRKSISLFNYIAVTGKGYFYIDVDKDENIIYEPKDSSKVFYPYDENTYWTHQGQWVAIKEKWSVSSFLQKYSDELDEKQREKYSALIHDSETFFPTPTGGAIEYGGVNESNTITVTRIWYKQYRKITKKHDKYFGKSLRKAEKNLYVADRYHSVVINDNDVVIAKIDEVQPRYNDNKQEVILPIVGKTYSGISDQAYSPVKATKELAELYMILHYQKELLIVASGVKGDIIDNSQIPSEMSPEEHRYHKKLGNLYIKTVDTHGRPINSAFNQWKGYDDTLPQSVQIIENMCQQIDQQIGIMMGVPTPVLGQVQKTDQVGTFEMSQEQAMIVTEMLYSECDEIETEATEVLVNLLSIYKNKEDDIVEVYQQDELLEYAQVPAEILKNKRFSLGVQNNAREEKNIKELKQIMYQYSQQGLLPFDTIVKLYDTYTLKDLKKSVEFMTKKSEEARQMAQQQGAEAEMQAEKARIDAAQEYEMMKKNIDKQINEMKIQMESSFKQGQLQLQQQQLEVKKQEVAGKLETEMAKIETEREVEMAYLQDQSKHQSVSHQLEALRLKIDAITSALDIDVKKTVGLSKAKTYGKEKIKD